MSCWLYGCKIRFSSEWKQAHVGMETYKTSQTRWEWHGLARTQTMSRGSHLYIPCRSVCDWDHNWIKRSKPSWGANQGIKVTSELLKINNQEHAAAIWPLTLENQAIKNLRRGRSSDQAHFLPIKQLDHDRKCFYRWHISEYSLHVAQVYKARNDTTILSHHPHILCHLATIWFAFVVCIGGLWKAVEWVMSVVHVHMHREWVVAAYNLIATDHGRHGRYGLFCMQSEQCWVSCRCELVHHP